jgi:ribonuclease HI
MALPPLRVTHATSPALNLETLLGFAAPLQLQEGWDYLDPPQVLSSHFVDTGVHEEDLVNLLAAGERLQLSQVPGALLPLWLQQVIAQLRKPPSGSTINNVHVFADGSAHLKSDSQDDSELPPAWAFVVVAEWSVLEETHYAPIGFLGGKLQMDDEMNDWVSIAEAPPHQLLLAAELSAGIWALLWLLQGGQESIPVTLNFDLLHLVKMAEAKWGFNLRGQATTAYHALLEVCSRKRSVHCLHVKGHDLHSYNETADSLAKLISKGSTLR